MHERQCRVLISGRVQGVSYRAWTRRNARELNLAGWVRNIADGRVEAVIAGPDKAVEEMLERFHKGPLLAKVSRVDLVECDEPCTDEIFQIR